MLIAQLSDLHFTTRGPVRGNIDSAATLDAAIAHLQRLDAVPDVVIASGDLVNDPDPDDYARLAGRLARLAPPVYLLPGNHDDRAMMRDAFGDQGYLPADGAFLNYAVDDFPLRVVAFDSMVPGEVGGRACTERLQWLERTLAAAPDHPTLLALHHPPFATGVAYMDRWRFDGAEALAEVIARHPQVQAVIAGHLHRTIIARWAGTQAMVAPSLVFQMDLRLAPGAESAFIAEPPGLLLHLWRPGQGLVTHTVVIGDFGAPAPFSRS
jgi:3',5'-cyclic AMP phosphodiesterase CpdA